MQLSLALDLFLGSCAAKGLQNTSIHAYDKFVNKFIKTVGDLEVEKLNYSIVQEYIQGLLKGNLSKSTVATYVRHLKVYIRYLESEEFIQPFSNKIKRIKETKKVIYIFSDDEIKNIFDCIDISPDWIRYRNCCIIALMLDSGLRRNEVCCIDTQDLDLRQNISKVHGKGDKERFVPLGQFTKHFMKKYLYSLPSYIKDTNQTAFFCTRDGSRLSNNTVKLLVQKLSKRLPFQFSCHKLRHNFATNYCIDEYTRSGQVDIYKLMMLLGHEDIKTTRRYLHLANQIMLSKTNVSHLDKVFT